MQNTLKTRQRSADSQNPEHGQLQSQNKACHEHDAALDTCQQPDLALDAQSLSAPARIAHHPRANNGHVGQYLASEPGLATGAGSGNANGGDTVDSPPSNPAEVPSAAHRDRPAF